MSENQNFSGATGPQSGAQPPQPASPASWQEQPGAGYSAGQMGSYAAPQPAEPAPYGVPNPVEGAASYPHYPVTQYAPAPQVEVRELAYHRLGFSDAKHRWWKPLAEGALGVLIYVVVVLAFTALGMVMLEMLYPEIGMGSMSSIESMTSLALENPVMFLIFFGSVALMFPVLWLVRLIFGPKPWGIIHSVRGRMRWGWLALCMGVAALVYIVIPTGLELALGSHYDFTPQAQGNDLMWLLALLILLVPVQCYAEELVFRGYLMQTIGRWLKHPAWAIVLPAPLFMLGHGYDLWGQLSVLTMGLLAGYLVWRTGGLEAAIALHVVNNLTAMGMGIFSVADPFLQEGATFANFAVALVTELIFLGIVLWLHKRKNLERVRPVKFYL